VDIERWLRPQPITTTSSHNSLQSRPPRPASTRPAAHHTTVQPPRAPAPLPPREPTEPAPAPVVKVRTEEQQARIKRKFLKMKEKRRAREREASQQHRLAQATHTSLRTGIRLHTSVPTHTTDSDGGGPTSCRGTKPRTTGNVHQPGAAEPSVNCETAAVDAWLAATSTSLEELPEISYDNKSFFTPAGSPNRQ